MFNNNNPFLNNYSYGNNNYMANPNMVPQYGNYTTPQQPYMQPQQPQQTTPQPQQVMATNTNKIFVNGIDDVKNRNLNPNSDYIFLDNDKALLYNKQVDSTGRMNVQVFQIVPYEEKKVEPVNNNIDMSNYVLKSDFDRLANEISDLKSKMNNSGGNNGNTKQSRANNKETEN